MSLQEKQQRVTNNLCCNNNNNNECVRCPPSLRQLSDDTLSQRRSFFAAFASSSCFRVTHISGALSLFLFPLSLSLYSLFPIILIIIIFLVETTRITHLIDWLLTFLFSFFFRRVPNYHASPGAPACVPSVFVPFTLLLPFPNILVVIQSFQIAYSFPSPTSHLLPLRFLCLFSGEFVTCGS